MLLVYAEQSREFWNESQGGTEEKGDEQVL